MFRFSPDDSTARAAIARETQVARFQLVVYISFFPTILLLYMKGILCLFPYGDLRPKGEGTNSLWFESVNGPIVLVQP